MAQVRAVLFPLAIEHRSSVYVISRWTLAAQGIVL
jgi:hypothetical protein